MRKEVETKSYKLALPLKIWIKGSKLVISDGIGTVEHSGEILLKSLSRSLAEFEVKLEQHMKPIIPKELEGGFIHSFSRPAKVRSRGILADYHYYKRKEDGAYCVVVWRGHRKRKFVLGSMGDSKSLLRRAWERLPHRPFYKKDLYETMPKLLKHGQVVKAVLDVLVEEGFVESKTINGLKEEYTKTSKSVQRV